MSGKERLALAKGLKEPHGPKVPSESGRSGQQKRRPDRRVRQTRGRLHDALVALMLDKPVDEIRVQEVLDLASVGRATFYFHYRDKDDLFLSVLEDGLEMWSTVLSAEQEKSRRVAPGTECFARVGGARKLYRALVDCGRIQAFFDLAQGYFARGIARRLQEIGPANLAQRGLDARSHAIAGNLRSLLEWWLDRGAKESPKAMDELFHRLVWTGIR